MTQWWWCPPACYSPLPAHLLISTAVWRQCEPEYKSLDVLLTSHLLKTGRPRPQQAPAGKGTHPTPGQEPFPPSPPKFPGPQNQRETEISAPVFPSSKRQIPSIPQNNEISKDGWGHEFRVELGWLQEYVACLDFNVFACLAHSFASNVLPILRQSQSIRRLHQGAQLLP